MMPPRSTTLFLLVLLSSILIDPKKFIAQSSTFIPSSAVRRWSNTSSSKPFKINDPHLPPADIKPQHISLSFGSSYSCLPHPEKKAQFMHLPSPSVSESSESESDGDSDDDDDDNDDDVDDDVDDDSVGAKDDKLSSGPFEKKNYDDPESGENNDNSTDDLPSNLKGTREEEQKQQQRMKGKDGGDNLGGFDPMSKVPMKREVLVGDPQKLVKEKEMSVTSILMELAAIQEQGPKKYCVLGTRHCSFLHQQIIELLAYALVLSGNHVYTSGAGGTHAAAIRGALRAERPDLLTVVLPQSLYKQPQESQDLLRDVEDVITMPQNDGMGLDVASRICNSYMLSQTDQLISFAFHESHTVIEATKEAQKLDMLVTTLYLD